VAPVLFAEDTLVITLEDLHTVSGRASIAATLGSVMGTASSRFVGRATSSDPCRRRHELTSPTYPRVRGLPDSVTPHEAWAPGMADALAELDCRLEAEGWRETGCGPSVVLPLRPAPDRLAGELTASGPGSGAAPPSSAAGP
jgi:hypothetical protein